MGGCFVALDAAHHVLHGALVVHFDGVDDAGTWQGLRNVLLLDDPAAIELLRFVELYWLRLYLQVDDEMVFSLRPIMLIGYLHPTDLPHRLLPAGYINHALVMTGHQRKSQEHKRLYR